MAQEEKKRHGGRTATIAAAAAVLLLAGGGMRSNGFGLLPNEGDSVLPEEGTTTVQEVVDRLEGIRCGGKPTSCPDQIARALKAYQAKQAEHA